MSEERKHSPLSQYVDTTGQLPNVQLKFSNWYLRHKITLQHIGIGILMGVAASLLVFNLWVWGSYFFIGYWKDQNILLRGQLNEFQNYEQMHNAYKAMNLNILNLKAFVSGKDVYDFSAEVANPNNRWIANIVYHFNYIGGETEVLNTYILPSTKRPVVAFGHESTAYPSEINFVIDKIKWESIDAHKIFDVGGYMNQRLNFSVDNFIFRDPTMSVLQVPSIAFDLYNDSSYSYWDAIFAVELLDENTVVGYSFLLVPKFLSGEKRVIDLRYFGENIMVNNIRVIPMMNVFDENIFINPEGEK